MAQCLLSPSLERAHPAWASSSWRPQRRSRRCGLKSAAMRAGPSASMAPRTEPPTGRDQYDVAWLWRQSVAMAAASAVLGPLCDGQHSSHDVLHYVAPAHLELGPLQLETCWWVPPMFGVAGIILGVSHPLLDAWQAERGGEQPRGGTDPTWAFVLASVTLFVLCYASSGVLEQPLLGATLPGLGVPALDALLFATAAAIWWGFDGTRQGLFMAALTAAAGPAVEMTLINVLHLYSYTHPVLLGTPTWICWVYAAGGPAVGNLGRKVSSTLLQQRGSAA